MILPTLTRRFAYFVALSALVSCKPVEKPGPPDKVIAEACKARVAQEEGGLFPEDKFGDAELVDIQRGTVLPAGNGAAKDQSVYPVRATYLHSRCKPVEWDQLSGLPRLPRDTERARRRTEFRFHRDEFGEWLWESAKASEWIDPPLPGSEGSRFGVNYGDRSRLSKALENADENALQRLLAESVESDRKAGKGKSHETKIRENWLKLLGAHRQSRPTLDGPPPKAENPSLRPPGLPSE